MDFFYLVIGALVGLVFGSGLNAWAWRSEHDNLRGRTRSACTACGRTLRWSELIPVVSFCMLRGKCATCRAPIPPWYVMTEVVGGLLGALVAASSLSEPDVVVSVIIKGIFVGIVFAVALYDGVYQLIPMPVVYAGGVLALMAQIFYIHASPFSVLIAILVAGIFFGGQYAISRGRWIGAGDIPLAIMLALWLGWPGFGIAVWFAYVLGAIVGVVFLALRKATRVTVLPLGTFLCVGALIALFWGENIRIWYGNLMR